jgi:hypothetical protein
MSKLASIPNAATCFGAVVVVCGTYLIKGETEGFYIERNFSTMLDVQFNQLQRRLDSMENDLNTEKVQSLTIRGAVTIDLIAKQTKCNISEDGVTVGGKIPFHIVGFDSFVILGKN